MKRQNSAKFTVSTLLALLTILFITTHVAAQAPSPTDPNFYSSTNPYYNAPDPSNGNKNDGWLRGQCTWYVWGRCADLRWFLKDASGKTISGDADKFYSSVKNGSGSGNTPALNAIECLPNLSVNGHVAFVIQVIDSNHWVTAEYNSRDDKAYHTENVSRNPKDATQVTDKDIAGYTHLDGFLYAPGGSAPAPAPDKTPPLGAIDVPYTSGLTVSGSATIVGWANDGHGQQTNLQSVQLLLDGSNMGQVSYPVPRSDGQLGFQLVWDTTKTSDGTHTITLHLVSKAAVTFDLSRTVIVNNPVSALPYPHVLGTNQILWPDQAICSDNYQFVLIMQDDGNLVLYARSPSGETPIWASNTQGHPGALAIMQNDGNFVVYDATWHPLWASGSRGANTYLIMQDDGNLVIYTSAGSPVWATNTH